MNMSSHIKVFHVMCCLGAKVFGAKGEEDEPHIRDFCIVVFYFISPEN